MAGTFKIDTTKFIKALRAYKAVTQKDEAEILNKRAKNIAYRCSQFTPKGNASRVRAALMKDPHLRFALTAIVLKKRGVGMLKSPEFQKEVDALVARRASSANYLRAAWANAIQQLGGSFNGAKFKGAGGFANKATVASLLAQIVAITNQATAAHAASAERIGAIALQEAIESDTADMIRFCRQQMGLTAKKFSSK